MDNINEKLKMAYGQVVNIRPIPSRGVTRIEIEIPDEAHVAVTTLLYGQDAVVIPWTDMKRPAIPYGLRQMSAFLSPAATDSAAPASPPASGFGPAPHRAAHDYVKLAATSCKDPAFWKMLSRRLGVEINSEEQAADALRMTLDIRSRADLASDRVAQTEFESMLKESRSLEVVG